MVMVQERGEGRRDWMACGGPMSDWVMDNRSKLPVSALLQSCNQDSSDEKRLLVLDLAQWFTLRFYFVGKFHKYCMCDKKISSYFL